MKPFALFVGLLFVGLLFVCGAPPVAGQECCDHCKCNACCRKICRCVPDVKKVTKPKYSCECEDFCVPGPSKRCVTYDECGKKKYVYTPTCAEVRTRVKLKKEETTKEVPTFKWVVETVCDNCASKCENCQPAPQQLPQPPAGPAPDDVLRASFKAPLPTPAPAAPGAGATSAPSRLRQALAPLLGSK